MRTTVALRTGLPLSQTQKSTCIRTHMSSQAEHEMVGWQPGWTHSNCELSSQAELPFPGITVQSNTFTVGRTTHVHPHSRGGNCHKGYQPGTGTINAGVAQLTLNSVPSGAIVSMPHPCRPLAAKKCLRSSVGEQPLKTHLAGGHTTTLLVRSSDALPVPVGAAPAVAVTPSGSQAVAPGSHRASAVGCAAPTHAS